MKARLSPLNSGLQFISKLKNNITQYWRTVFLLRFGRFTSIIAKCFFSMAHKQTTSSNSKQQLLKLWSDVFDLLDDPVCFIDLDDCLMKENHDFFYQIDLPKEKAIGRPITHLIHYSADQTTQETNDPSNPQENHPIEIRIRIIRDQRNTPIGILQTQHDLSHLHSTQTALRISKNKLAETQHIAGIAQDITEQKRAEEALQEEKERAQITLQSIGDAVITSDIYGIIDYINAKAADPSPTSFNNH